MHTLLHWAFAASLLGASVATSVAHAGQAPAPAPAPEQAAPPGRLDPERLAASLAGTYSSSLASAGVVSIRVAAPGILVLKTGDFWSVGYFDGEEFGGVERTQRGPIARTPSGAMAWVRMTVLPDGRLEVTRWTGPADGDATREVWSRSANPSAPAPPAAQDDCGQRPFGAYVYVETLPQAVTRVPPDYPDVARRHGVQGTVVVQVLVNCEGRVVDTKVVSSIPDLDAAAVAAARQWVFTPGLGAPGKPVSVWVAVPMKFTLH
jgi:TonB family protein